MATLTVTLPPRKAVVYGAWASTVLILTASLGVGIMGYLAADRLVHPPREHRHVTPMHRGIAFDDVVLLTEDGLHLAAWWMPARGEELGTVIFLHGYGASKAQSLGVAPFLHRAGYNVLAFDFRAHGWSEGSYTTFGIEETADVRAAYRYLVDRGDVDPSRVALFGWSMGASAALLASGTLPEVKAFITDSAFASLNNVVTNSLASLTGLPAFPFVPVTIGFASWMTRHTVSDIEPANAVGSMGRPLLVIHGLRDALVRHDVDAMALQQAAGERGELWLVPDADHVNARRYHPQEYEARVLNFLATHLGGPILPETMMQAAAA